MLGRVAFSQYLLIQILILSFWQIPSGAEEAIAMKLTMYDDGLSCPAGCDAHVVFHSNNNGTPNAHLPTSEPGAYKKCIPNQECRICFNADPQNCMIVMYRGNGPHTNTFDLTPSFYEKYCSKSDIPEPLVTQCKLLTAGAKKLEGHINCIREDHHPKCIEIIAQAKERKGRDQPLYEACSQQGELVFNRNRPLSDQRSNDCAYEQKATGGPNSQGQTWRKLLPAACREGTFVGRDGLDCCSGNIFRDGPLGVECENFYLRP